VWDALFILAQEQAAKPKEPPWWSMLPPMIAVLGLFFMLMIWPQRKEQQKREQLLNSLKKNDRVVTLGGMIGTIANVSPDGKEITLKVDDNTRIKFVRSGIANKLDDGGKDEAGKPA
jgi:preprotein translocase subunit YajC